MTQRSNCPRRADDTLDDYRWARAVIALLAVGMIVGAILTT